MTWLSILLIASGMTLLASSLPSISSILSTLGHGRLRSRWLWLRALILAFIAGYAVFALLHIGMSESVADLVVSAILAAGGGFVLVVARLSDLTTSDIVRIAALERDVVRDPLTGLFNRRYLDAKLDEEVSRSRRSGAPLSALIIDLDHFKHINDSYGHAIGDQVIRHASDLIAEQVRSCDTVFRYGGEEFVVLAAGSDIEAAAALGDRVRCRIAERMLTLPDGRELAVTASLGIADCGADDTPAELLRAADAALYAAKRGGRNRLCRAVERPAREAA